MTMRTGDRCPFRKTSGDLCARHERFGAIIPDLWTSPDNLPVWLYEANPQPPNLTRDSVEVAAVNGLTTVGEEASSK